MTVSTVLSPSVQRDGDIPDIGYHFDPLDYLASNLSITNISLLLTNGVAFGYFGNSAVELCAGAKFISEGSPITALAVCNGSG